MAKTTRKATVKSKSKSDTKSRTKKSGKKKSDSNSRSRSKHRAEPKESASLKRASAGDEPESGFFGLPLNAWVAGAKPARGTEARSAKTAQVFFFNTRDPKKVRSGLRSSLLPWQLEHALKSEAETVSYAGRTGPVFVLRPATATDAQLAASHGGRLEKVSAARARDQVGAIYPQLGSWKSEAVAFSFFGTSIEEERFALLGLEMAAYSYAENRDNPRKTKKRRPRILLKESQLKGPDLRWASALGQGVNVARHLINLPGGVLNPASFANAVRVLFDGVEGVEVDIWSDAKLATENMNLLTAVGGAAAEGPRLVHIRYRPAVASARKPLALVGKGITFDSGGLDIKPSSAMRWMKKDMGGSAAVVGAVHFAAKHGIAQPLDVYLALAENAVAADSFRPGDILTARNGLTIEIHNTDAEGRLVLADALDVAVKNSDEPLAVINLATLTGAIKVALGGEIAGLFSNHDGLAALIEEAGVAAGELTWRMPLFQPYKASLKSTFGDFANASDGFAGAITAALFLQQFVGKTPWAHLDIYSWRDSAGGAYAESGGSGQGVQLLAQLLERWSDEEI